MRPLRPRFLSSSSVISAGRAVAGSGSPPVRMAVAFDTATTDTPCETTAAHGLAARLGSRPKPIRANPMIRFVPEDIREYTGPYPEKESADAHATAAGAGSA